MMPGKRADLFAGSVQASHAREAKVCQERPCFASTKLVTGIVKKKVTSIRTVRAPCQRTPASRQIWSSPGFVDGYGLENSSVSRALLS